MIDDRFIGEEYCRAQWSIAPVAEFPTLEINGTEADIILVRQNKPPVKLGELADHVYGEKAKREEAEAKAKEEKVLGAVAIALSGAGAIANKNPVISRRFWKR